MRAKLCKAVSTVWWSIKSINLLNVGGWLPYLSHWSLPLLSIKIDWNNAQLIVAVCDDLWEEAELNQTLSSALMDVFPLM